MVSAAEYVTSTLANQAAAIELVSIGMPTDVVEGHVKTIRAMGTAVHAAYTPSAEAFEAHLENHDVHVVLFDAEQDSFDIKTLLNICHTTGADASIVVVGGNPDALPHPGVRDWLGTGDDPRAAWVVVREHGDLMKRRQLREARRRLHETEHRCDALMESSKEAIAYVHEGMHVRANPVYLDLFGIDGIEDMEGLPLMDLVSKDMRSALKGFLNARHSGSEGPGYLEMACRSLSGDEFPATLEFAPATIDGEPCVQIIVRQDTSAQELERLQELAARDHDTGLYNRNHFLAGVERKMPSLYASDAHQFALLYLAVDQFAEIRDSRGLDCAEGILREVADVLKETVPPEALLARFGDYSFSLLLEVESKNAAEQLAETLRRKVEEHAFASTEDLIMPTVSVGVARSKQGRIATAQEFVDRAYKAFQTATLAGGNRVAAYESADDAAQQAGGDAAAIEMIEFATAHNRIRLRFQPMLEPKRPNHRNYFVEPYLRDADDREHPVGPLLQAAQQAGQLLDIDYWLIEQSLLTIRESAQPQALRFHIPLSRAALAGDGFLARLRSDLDATSVDPRQLTFVLHSDDVRQQLSKVKLTVSALAKLGCRTMIDAFGATPEDQAVLKHVPDLSGARLDPSLSRHLEDNPDSIARLRDTAARLHQLGLSAVVTEVENASALAQFWGLGIDFIQGEFLSPPLENPDFIFG